MSADSRALRAKRSHPRPKLVEARRVGALDSVGLPVEGAHAGVGLGHEFLRHVQRTKVLVHLVEPDPMDQTDPLQNYKQIREELRLYDQRLAERPEILFVSKSELPDDEALGELLREETGKPVGLLSAATGQGLTDLIRQLTAILKEAQQDEDAAAAST